MVLPCLLEYAHFHRLYWPVNVNTKLVFRILFMLPKSDARVMYSEKKIASEYLSLSAYEEENILCGV